MNEEMKKQHEEAMSRYDVAEEPEDMQNEPEDVMNEIGEIEQEFNNLLEEDDYESAYEDNSEILDEDIEEVMFGNDESYIEKLMSGAEPEPEPADDYDAEQELQRIREQKPTQISRPKIPHIDMSKLDAKRVGLIVAGVAVWAVVIVLGVKLFNTLSDRKETDVQVAQTDESLKEKYEEESAPATSEQQPEEPEPEPTSEEINLLEGETEQEQEEELTYDYSPYAELRLNDFYNWYTVDYAKKEERVKYDSGLDTVAVVMEIDGVDVQICGSSDSTGYIMYKDANSGEYMVWKFNNPIDWTGFTNFHYKFVSHYPTGVNDEYTPIKTEEQEPEPQEPTEPQEEYEEVTIPKGYAICLGYGNEKFVWNNRGFLASDYGFNNQGKLIKTDTNSWEGYKYFGAHKIDTSTNDSAGVNFYIGGLWYTWRDAMYKFGNPGTVNDAGKQYPAGNPDVWKETGCFYNRFGATKIEQVRIEDNGEVWFKLEGFDDEVELNDVEEQFGQPNYAYD